MIAFSEPARYSSTRTLGEGGIEVSRLCLGTWQSGASLHGEELARGIATMRAGFDSGINFFDTAASYGDGGAEVMLADALWVGGHCRRDEVVVATKGGVLPDGRRNSTRSSLTAELEASLRRLRTDYVDIFFVHWPDPKTAPESLAETLAGFVASGKARLTGVSNYARAELAELSGLGVVQVIQPPYHLFRRSEAESLMSLASDFGMGVCTYAPMAHGLLSGAVTRSTRFPASDWRARSRLFSGPEEADRIDVVEELARIAMDCEITLGQLAVAWVLSNPCVDSCVFGAQAPEQLHAVRQDVSLSIEILRRIEELVESVPQVGGPTPEGFW
ncbi:MAG: aldo/keto reductase [Propionibacteriaceae bacterium]|nr:aldo/keto reductase [Propionibacteriaceae bacterium]